ncbi:MAG TPA: hypothetical protein VMG59_12135 [Phycisphaerae bacterium]|nr:hypothetical protein [Phycisphaerae bacterium]
MSQKDEIQEAVIAKVEKLGLNSYSLGQAVDGKISQRHIYDYLHRRKSMGSNKLQHLLKVLGMKIMS